jgi:pimeloyl-ACP methyl ester carboxylesterase
MKRADTTDVLKKSQVPVLFIIGIEDIAAPLQDALQQCHLPLQSHIYILEKVGHMGMMESAESVSIFINQFLSNSIITN